MNKKCKYCGTTNNLRSYIAKNQYDFEGLVVCNVCVDCFSKNNKGFSGRKHKQSSKKINWKRSK